MSSLLVPSVQTVSCVQGSFRDTFHPKRQTERPIFLDMRLVHWNVCLTFGANVYVFNRYPHPAINTMQLSEEPELANMRSNSTPPKRKGCG